MSYEYTLPSGSVPSASPSLSSTLDKVKPQVEYRCFACIKTGRVDPLYDELCLVVAETLLLNPDSSVKVNGSPTGIYLIQEVFQLLRGASTPRF